MTQKHHRLYSKGPCPLKFYGTAKLQKLKSNDKVNQFLIRQIFSNNFFCLQINYYQS